MSENVSITKASRKAESFWSRHFELKSRQANVKREVLSGITGFLAASYLLIVIPGLLAQGGIDRGAATTGVIVVFVLGTLFMALYGNLPFMVGPGIGGSVLVGVTMISDGVSWQVGLGIASLSGVLFFILTVCGLREMVTRAVPPSIKLGLTASIGIFVALLGFRNAGLVMVNTRTSAMMLGNFMAYGALVALAGLMIAIALQARRVPGAILWAILLATLLGIPLGVTKLPETFFTTPHSIAPVFGQVDFLGALNLAHLPYLFVFFASEFFSTMGTTLAVGAKAGLVDDKGNMKNIHRPFVVDSVAASLGPVVAVPGATALIESSAIAESGGKTGLAALAAAGMFFLMLLFTPIALMIPKEATAPALILIGLNMFCGLNRINLSEFSDSFPVLMMVMLTLIANSFGTGIAGGLLFYIIVKVISGRWREIPLSLVILALPLVYYFATLVKH